MFFAEKITDFFIKNNIVAADDRPIYKYGTEITLSTILGFFIVLTIGALSNNIINSVIFLFCFASIRIYSGGYHANTYLKCNVIYTSLFIIILILANTVFMNIDIYFNIILLITSVVFISIFSPIENKNKPLTAAEKTKNKKKSIFVSLIWAILSLILYVFHFKIYSIIVITMFVITILMIIEKTNQKINLKGDFQ